MASAPPPESDGFVDVSGSRQQHELLAIDPQARPYRVRLPQAYVEAGDEFVSRVRVCVTESGAVANVDVLRPSIAAVDEQLPKVISRWHYRPYVIEGQATAFCYPMNYRVY
jgi:TonB family protein